MSELQKTLKKIKNIEWETGLVSLWVVERDIKNRTASYEILKVEAEEKLKLRLRNIIKKKVEDGNQIEEYAFVSEDQDQRLFAIKTEETDFKVIRDEIEKIVNQGSQNRKITSADQLIGAWAYIVRLDVNGEILYGFRQVSRLWNTKKTSWMNLLFEKEMLVDLEDKQVFHVDQAVDFLGFQDRLLILDKKHFEAALNFRAGMEHHRDEVLDEFEKAGIIHDVAELRNAIGNNIRHLRRISEIRKNGYYRDKQFLKKLADLNEKRQWGLIYQGSAIKVNGNVELVLVLLNNDRLLSEISEETFDVAVKKPV